MAQREAPGDTSRPKNRGSRFREKADGPEFLRTAEVAQRLGLSTRRVQLLLKKGLLPGTRVGRVWYVPRVALETYIRALVARAHRNIHLDLEEK